MCTGRYVRLAPRQFYSISSSGSADLRVDPAPLVNLLYAVTELYFISFTPFLPEQSNDEAQFS